MTLAKSRQVLALAILSAYALVAVPSAAAQAPEVRISPYETASTFWFSGQFKGPTAYASSPSGIRLMVAKIDGREVRRQEPPCTSCTRAQIDLAPLGQSYADGRHVLTVEAVDGNGAVGSVSAPIQVDNTPPTGPSDVRVGGGIGWQPLAHRSVQFTHPPQAFAPLMEVYFLLCPIGTPVHNDPGSVPDTDSFPPACIFRRHHNGEAGGIPPAKLPDDFALPSPGLWTLRIWYVDAAYNASLQTATVIDGLGYDPTPPNVSGFVAQEPNDPARLSVAASDDGAPITGGTIEVRRRGRNVWRPLKTEVNAGGLTALMDDERLRRGRYRLRATVVNAAGLQQGTDRSAADGSLKSLALPIRLGSRLQAGRRIRKICRRQGNRRRCRFKLTRRVPVELGRPITLRARLISQHKPIAHQPLELWERVSVTGAKWKQIGTLQSNRRGRVRYKAPPGVARKLRFRYPGTPHVRGDNDTITLNVRAKSSIDVSRRNVINGEYVTFRGRLKSRPIPAQGVLVELQVRSRGKWRTFAQPRANAKGAWRYQYRFETVRGGARYRFRARVRRQAGYPYATGSSRQIGVRVHGL